MKQSPYLWVDVVPIDTMYKKSLSWIFTCSHIWQMHAEDPLCAGTLQSQRLPYYNNKHHNAINNGYLCTYDLMCHAKPYMCLRFSLLYKTFITWIWCCFILRCQHLVRHTDSSCKVRVGKQESHSLNPESLELLRSVSKHYCYQCHCAITSPSPALSRTYTVLLWSA